MRTPPLRTCLRISNITPTTRAHSSAKPRRPSSKLGPTVSLDHFLQRSKAISLYRRILRDCRRIPDAGSREETRRFVRDDFERNRGVTDLVGLVSFCLVGRGFESSYWENRRVGSQIKYLIGTGKTQWEGMERYITGI
ncbi:LYR motif-containing protein 2 [Botrytis cinerea]